MINYAHENTRFKAHFHLVYKGNLSLEKSQRKKSCDWLANQGWEDIVKLAELFPEQFSSLPDDIEKHPTEWQSVSGHRDRTHYRHTSESTVSVTHTLFLFSGTTWMDQNRLRFP